MLPLSYFVRRRSRSLPERLLFPHCLLGCPQCLTWQALFEIVVSVLKEIPQAITHPQGSHRGRNFGLRPVLGVRTSKYALRRSDTSGHVNSHSHLVVPRSFVPDVVLRGKHMSEVNSRRSWSSMLSLRGSAGHSLL
jgi:hypothetical protein